jgi:hypothetical protein
MSYKIASDDLNGIVFERYASGCARALFIGVGLIFVVVGTGIVYFSPGNEFPTILFKLLFPSFGLGAVVLGIFLPKLHGNEPARITFDHPRAVVAIQMDKDNSDAGFIRYDEIDKFDIYVESRSSSGSSSSVRRTTYYYHVFLRKKDGGEWFLTQSSTRESAEAIRQKLISSVQTKRPPSSIPSPALTDKITREEKMDKTGILWQNKVGIAAFIFLLLVAAVFLGIVGMILGGTFGEIEAFVYFVLGFIILIFVTILFFVVRKMIKDATTRYSVLIGKATVEYQEISKSTDAVKYNKSIPMAEIHSVSYSYAPVKHYAGSGLVIASKSEYDKMMQERESPMEALKSLFSSKNKPMVLSISSLNPMECLQLEAWLQEVIRKKGGAVL